MLHSRVSTPTKSGGVSTDKSCLFFSHKRDYVTSPLPVLTVQEFMPKTQSLRPNTPSDTVKCKWASEDRNTSVRFLRRDEVRPSARGLMSSEDLISVWLEGNKLHLIKMKLTDNITVWWRPELHVKVRRQHCRTLDDIRCLVLGGTWAATCAEDPECWKCWREQSLLMTSWRCSDMRPGAAAGVSDDSRYQKIWWWQGS